MNSLKSINTINWINTLYPLDLKYLWTPESQAQTSIFNILESFESLYVVFFFFIASHNLLYRDGTELATAPGSNCWRISRTVI